MWTVKAGSWEGVKSWTPSTAEALGNAALNRRAVWNSQTANMVVKTELIKSFRDHLD